MNNIIAQLESYWDYDCVKEMHNTGLSCINYKQRFSVSKSAKPELKY